MGRYYFDTCIWRDFYEDRFSNIGRPLGEYAYKLFGLLIKNKHTLLYSEFIIKELKIYYDEEEIKDMLNILFISRILKKAEVTEKDFKEARKIGTERNLPVGDVLHAIIAKKNKALFISQDKHAQRLKDLVDVRRPEELI